MAVPAEVCVRESPLPPTCVAQVAIEATTLAIGEESAVLSSSMARHVAGSFVCLSVL